MFSKVHEVLPEVHEVLPEGIETCRGGMAEIAEFAAELAHVAIGGSRKYTSGGGIMRTCLHSTRQIAHLLLESRDTWLEILGPHEASLQVTADKRTHLFPAHRRHASPE